MWLERLTEAFQTIRKRPRAFFMHCYGIALIGFLTTFLSYSYTRLACSSFIPNTWLFWIYLVFNGFVFAGSIVTPFLVKWIQACRLMFFTFAIGGGSLWLYSLADNPFYEIAVFAVAGLVSGISSSAIVFSFLMTFHQTNFSLVHMLFLCRSFGELSASLFFRPIHFMNFDYECDGSVQLGHTFHKVLGQERFHLTLPLDYICFAFAALQLPIMYLLLTTVVGPLENDQLRGEYEDIEPGTEAKTERNESPCLKLVLLSGLIACTATVIQSIFPFIIFSHPDGSISYCQVLALFVLWGRVVAIVSSDRVAPYFYVGISIMGCGAACCAFIFDGGLLLGAILFGFFLSAFLPSLIVYIRHTLLLKVETVFVLLAASSFGQMLFPIFLTMTSETGNRIFTTFFFFSVLFLVLIYVSMLNIQAQLERTKATQDKFKMFIDRFFSGENLMKRTRSIRPLISRLRPNSYKRFKERRALRNKVPTIEVTLSTENQTSSQLHIAPDGFSECVSEVSEV